MDELRRIAEEQGARIEWDTTPIDPLNPPQPVRIQSAIIPVSIEAMIDAGLDVPNPYRALYEADRATHEAAFRALPWRVRFWRTQVTPRWWEARSRLAHAARALRGIECERDD